MTETTTERWHRSEDGRCVVCDTAWPCDFARDPMGGVEMSDENNVYDEDAVAVREGPLACGHTVKVGEKFVWTKGGSSLCFPLCSREVLAP